MKKIIVICFLFVGVGMFAQHGGSIKGHILDQEMANEPLMFANLELKGTSSTVQSNLFGKFEMTDIAPGTYILAISHAGYETIEVPIAVKANEVTEIQQRIGAEKLSIDELIRVTESSKDVENFSSSLTSREKE